MIIKLMPYNRLLLISKRFFFFKVVENSYSKNLNFSFLKSSSCVITFVQAESKFTMINQNV